MQHCPNCGSNVADGSQACPECGAAIAGGQHGQGHQAGGQGQPGQGQPGQGQPGQGQPGQGQPGQGQPGQGHQAGGQGQPGQGQPGQGQPGGHAGQPAAAGGQRPPQAGQGGGGTSRRDLLLYGGGGAALLGGGWFVFLRDSGSSVSGPAGVSKAFYKALNNGNREKANGYVHSDSPQGEVSEQRAAVYDNADFSVDGAEVLEESDGEATVEVTVSAQGDSNAVPVELRKTDGDWKVWRYS